MTPRTLGGQFSEVLVRDKWVIALGKEKCFHVPSVLLPTHRASRALK